MLFLGTWPSASSWSWDEPFPPARGMPWRNRSGNGKPGEDQGAGATRPFLIHKYFFLFL